MSWLLIQLEVSLHLWNYDLYQLTENAYEYGSIDTLITNHIASSICRGR